VVQLRDFPRPGHGRREVKFQIDSDKMKTDAEKARTKIGGGAAPAEEVPEGK
jgi:hypothetical protein